LVPCTSIKSGGAKPKAKKKRLKMLHKRQKDNKGQQSTTQNIKLTTRNPLSTLVNSGALEWQTVSALLLATVVLLV